VAARTPVRTCVGCGVSEAKRSLLRVVRAADGSVRVDRSGSAPGRGAYVHRDRSCVLAALGRGALARALRTSLDADRAVTLKAEIEGALGR
jgi:hypothetical protein